MGEVAPADVFGAVAAMADAWDGTCGLSNMRTRHGPTDSLPYRPLASIVHSAQRYVIDFIFWWRYPLAVTWAVAFHMAFVPEFRNLPRQVQDEVYAVGRLLERFGPQLGRPQVDTLNGSRYANMKEMRLSAADGEWRVAFAFDPERRAVLLVAGEKSGGSQRRFYRALIRKADERFDRHLAQLADEGGS